MLGALLGEEDERKKIVTKPELSTLKLWYISEDMERLSQRKIEGIYCQQTWFARNIKINFQREGNQYKSDLNCYKEE